MTQNLGEPSTELIKQHVEKTIGKVAGVFHEIVSDVIHVDIIVVEPTPENNTYNLITSGMSDKKMNLPYEIDEYSEEYLELMITLPGSWKLDFNDEQWFWPIKLLKSLARFPHLYKTHLGYGHTMQNGNYDNYANNTQLCGSILLPIFGENNETRRLKVNDKKTIHFYSVLPLYKGEIEYALRNGSNDFFGKLIENDFSLEVDINREKYKL